MNKMLEKVLSVVALQHHRDQLAYGLAFVLWGVLAYVEVEAYGARESAELVFSLQLLTSLVAVLAMAIDGTFKPQLLIKFDYLKVRLSRSSNSIERYEVPFSRCSGNAQALAHAPRPLLHSQPGIVRLS